MRADRVSACKGADGRGAIVAGAMSGCASTHHRPTKLVGARDLKRSPRTGVAPALVVQREIEKCDAL
jgi:hypothetical protein